MAVCRRRRQLCRSHPPRTCRRPDGGRILALECDKDLDAIEAALDETGLALTSLVAEPMIALTDAANRQSWLKGLAESVAVSRRLGAPVLIAQAGDDLPGVSREEQRRALTETLKAGADILKGSGVRLGVEPLNIRIDHIGYFLDSTREGLDIVSDVSRPEIGIVYDIYHSAVMDERTEEVLDGRLDRVFHVHVADHPGRSEPGSGGIDLAHRLNWIFANGYDGAIGLEYRPSRLGAEAVRVAIASLGG
ncbi:hydroxypyruvate isomerase domain-containing protein [Rhizobium etli bv. mimosae str. IE4771]|uniref:Hydroxypyruvate isomerase domain-containing protein n=1 Tax=Rhizobium etli bv. mimosae str. IE4771 TaxID=1432050 RepID=A0A060I4R1_RHIET|nr:hydroxypyruvate isomerase domain-containing protein [Rhizobium sp. IE4771]